MTEEENLYYMDYEKEAIECDSNVDAEEKDDEN